MNSVWIRKIGVNLRLELSWDEQGAIHFKT